MAKKKVSKSKKRTINKSSSKKSNSIKNSPLSLKHYLDPFALAYTLASLRVIMLIFITVIKNPGLVEFAEKLHFTYDLTFNGIITGVAETAIWGMMGFLIGWLYNKFL